MLFAMLVAILVGAAALANVGMSAGMTTTSTDRGNPGIYGDGTSTADFASKYSTHGVTGSGGLASIFTSTSTVIPGYTFANPCEEYGIPGTAVTGYVGYTDNHTLNGAVGSNENELDCTVTLTKTVVATTVVTVSRVQQYPPGAPAATTSSTMSEDTELTTVTITREVTATAPDSVNTGATITSTIGDVSSGSGFAHSTAVPATASGDSAAVGCSVAPDSGTTTSTIGADASWLPAGSAMTSGNMATLGCSGTVTGSGTTASTTRSDMSWLIPSPEGTIVTFSIVGTTTSTIVSETISTTVASVKSLTSTSTSTSSSSAIPSSQSSSMSTSSDEQPSVALTDSGTITSTITSAVVPTVVSVPALTSTSTSSSGILSHTSSSICTSSNEQPSIAITYGGTTTSTAMSAPDTTTVVSVVFVTLLTSSTPSSSAVPGSTSTVVSTSSDKLPSTSPSARPAVSPADSVKLGPGTCDLGCYMERTDTFLMLNTLLVALVIVG